MSFTAITDFVGEIYISNTDRKETELTEAITKYEKEVLISALGYELYALLIADLDDNGIPQTERFVSLVNGIVFTNDFYGKEYPLMWDGLKSTTNQSFLAYYIFYKYVERNATHLADVGNISLDADSGKRVSPINMMRNAWYSMRGKYGIIPVQYRGRYRLPLNVESSLIVFNNDPSIYNFLIANVDTYPEWVYNPIWGMGL